MKQFAGKRREIVLAVLLALCASTRSQAHEQSSQNNSSTPGGVRVCCRPLPKWSGSKNWFLLALNRMIVNRLRHCYIDLGYPTAASGRAVYGQTWSIHPVRPDNDNKQPIPDQITESLSLEGECKNVADATPEKIKLLEEQLVAGTCPSCGKDYHNRVLSGCYNNSNTYVFELISRAGMTPPRMGGAPGYRRSRACVRSSGDSSEKRHAAGSLPACGSMRNFRGANPLAAFSKDADANILVYFNNENDFQLMTNGQPVSLDLKTHLSAPEACCAHRATAALSHDGTRIAFVRMVSARPRREVVSTVDVRSREIKEMFSAQVVWGISWSPDDQRLAVIADAEAPRQHALHVIELPSGAAREAVRGGVELDGVQYILSDYARASWNREGTSLAVEFRRSGFGANSSRAGIIVVLDLTTNKFRKLSDGVEPSWSPAGDLIAFFDASRKKCFAISPDSGEAKLLFSSSKGLPAGASPFVFPVVWSPDGGSLIFHEWVDADLIVDVYRYDVLSGKRKRLGTSELQVVDWR